MKNEANGATSTLVICPHCKKLGKNQVLGRILENGDFLILRFQHGTTLLQAEIYNVQCGCGWSQQVKAATLSSIN